jgi:hypothetical protein
VPPRQSWPTAGVYEIAAGQGEWSSPLRPVHPGGYCGFVAPATIWVETGLERVSLGGSEQAEFASADDRGSAVLDAQFAVQRALVGLHGVQRNIEPLADLTA